MRLRPDRPRCAALAPRVIAELCAAVRAAGSFAPLPSSQPTILGFIHTSPRASQVHVQFVHVGRRGEKRGHDARAIGWPCRAALF